MRSFFTPARPAWSTPVAAVAALMGVGVIAPVLHAQETSGEFEIGGPLAGMKLPLFPSQYNAPPGHPGAIPESAIAAKVRDVKSGDFTVQIANPQYQLYPGSVENWRAYWQRRVGTRSMWDAQSLVKNFSAASLPSVTPNQIEQYAAPIYWVSEYGSGIPSGKSAAPVSVLRMKVGNPILKLELGQLKAGLYAVRVIGAIETAKLRPFTAPQFLILRINDGLNGERNTYHIRISATDEFYSVGEIYFHAPTERAYTAELGLDVGSAEDLLVHNVTLDNVLAGAAQRPIKTRQTLFTPQDLSRTTTLVAKEVAEASGVLQSLNTTQRMARDAAIWKALPPLNTVGSYVNYHGPTIETYFEAGSDKQTGAQIQAEWGKWERAPGALGSGAFFPIDAKEQSAFLVNKKLGLEYSVDDLWARKPLPNPYPFKDEGSGLFFPDANDKAKGKVLAPIADAVGPRLLEYHRTLIDKGIENFRATGNDAFLRDAAVALVRFAYQFPTYDTANYLTPVALSPGPYDRDSRFRQRHETSTWFDNGNPYGYMELLRDYDKLFPFIKGNEELAQSIGRFVPWIQSSSDVVKLMDVYLVQHEAKRILRYHDFTFPTAIAETAAVLGDASITDPWMEWLFTKTYKYPLKPLGLPEMLINGYDRDGAEYRGSSFYARTGGHSSAAVASEMDSYLAANGNSKFNVRDPQRFPKSLAQTHWETAFILAGIDYPRVGDVTGPEKPFGLRMSWMGSMEEASRLGWRWSKDAKFAWNLVNFFGRKGESDADWKAINEAAPRSGLRRAPWLDNRSRVLANWAGILETGLQHDDFRFRRAAYLRVGLGYGHHHDDTFDLHVFAHGLPMTIDAGQRPGYSTPSDRISRVHNTVEVDGEDFRAHSWAQTLTDAEGARYLRANAVPRAGSTLFQRQIALIDVDEGSGSQPLSPAQQKPDAVLGKGIMSPNSYVFDVFRVAGGKQHTYAFHSTTEDEFNWNAQNVAAVSHIEKPDGENAEADYLAPFKVSGPTKFAGDAPKNAPFEATWRWPQKGTGSEEFMLQQNFDKDAPRKWVRLHLFNANDARALKADMVSEKWSYRFTNLMVQRKGANLQSAFAAVVEPYAGAPFISSSRVLQVANNEADALRAVALEVKTTNGHTDVNMADGRPDKIRTIGALQFAGEWAYHSRDAQGLRQASLSGGTLLSTPDVRLQVTSRERTAKVLAADYPNKTLTLDGRWPANATGLFEIGTPGRMTAYDAKSVSIVGTNSQLQLTHGADYYRSRVESVDAKTGVVSCRDEMPLGQTAGLDKSWVASDEERRHFWRADSLGDGKFKLRGAPVNQAAFGASGVLRLWECGAGDFVRQSTFASLRRAGADVFVLQANAPLTVGLRGSGVLLSQDGKTWRAPKTVTRVKGWTTVTIAADAVTQKSPLYLKIAS